MITRILAWALIAALGYVVGVSLVLRIQEWRDRHGDDLRVEKRAFMAWANAARNTPAYGVPRVVP